MDKAINDIRKHSGAIIVLLLFIWLSCWQQEQQHESNIWAEKHLNAEELDQYYDGLKDSLESFREDHP